MLCISISYLLPPLLFTVAATVSLKKKEEEENEEEEKKRCEEVVVGLAAYFHDFSSFCFSEIPRYTIHALYNE